MSFSPKKLRLTNGGEAARAQKFRPREKYNGLNQDTRLFKPKRRNSDGPASRALRVFYIRASAADDKIKQLFRPFGNIRFFRRDLERSMAFIVYEKRKEALSAKRKLEHSYQDINLRASDASDKLLMKAWGGLKIDCVEVDVAQPESSYPVTSYFKRN